MTEPFATVATLTGSFSNIVVLLLISNQIHLVVGQLKRQVSFCFVGFEMLEKMHSLDKCFAALETLVAVLTLNSHVAVAICMLGQGLPI